MPSSLSSCERSLTTALKRQSSTDAGDEALIDKMRRWDREGVEFWRESPKVFLRYQAQWTSDRSSIKVCEKSRRIGISWADAADAVLIAAERGGSDVYYIGYNAEMAETYVRDAADWARHFSLFSSQVEEFLFKDDDEDESILAFRVRFASGKQIVALSSRPKNLRSKKGHLRVDEAAFHDDFDELLKAAIAIRMWGGTIAIWSTHDGVDNAFNLMVEKIRKAELDYSLHRFTLKDAIADGLYERICLVQGIEWTLEGEFAWEAELRAAYGPAAAEELDVIPFAGGEGSVFSRHWFNPIPASLAPIHTLTCRHWDIAATAKQIAKKTHYYTAGTKIAKRGDRYTILHSTWSQCGPGDVEALITTTAKADGRSVLVGIELEGGSEAILWAESFSRTLRQQGFNVEFRPPKGDKVVRAIPFATEAQNGFVDIVEGPWTEEYLDCLQRFDGSPQPKINDVADSSSGAYALLRSRGTGGPVVQPKQESLKKARVFG